MRRQGECTTVKGGWTSSNTPPATAYKRGGAPRLRYARPLEALLEGREKYPTPARCAVNRQTRVTSTGVRRVVSRSNGPECLGGYLGEILSRRACISASFVGRTRHNSGSSLGRPSQI